MADLSAEAATARQDADGTNRIAVVLDDVVDEAPIVSGGQGRLSVTSQGLANQDAAVWNVGAMPLRLVSSSVGGRPSGGPTV